LEQQLTFRLQAYEGPLDLLLSLIQKNKVNIYDIPIASILEQYLEVLNEMEIMDLEVSSEFLVLAATLLNIKSRMLLPKQVDDEDEGEDPREELVRRLVEYQKYKEASQFLGENHGKGYLSFFKLPDHIKPPPRGFDTMNLTIENLVLAFSGAFSRGERKTPPPRASFDGIVAREKVSIRAMVKNVWKKLIFGTKRKFVDIFQDCKSRAEVVATFLAVLELMKLKKINVDYVKKDKEFMINKLEDNVELEIDITENEQTEEQEEEE